MQTLINKSVIFIKNNLHLFLILIISIFFRFYKFNSFHYFSGDEEVLTATIRHIIWDKSPSLLVQNASLGFGLGPFYHYLLTPFYFVTNFDLVGIQVLGSILGVVTTFIVYLGGKEFGGRKMGLLSAFLYASSFFISFHDRRVVHLTLNPFMGALTFLVLAKVVNKKYKFIPLLSLSVGFAFHEDASLLVLAVAIIFSWIFFKFPLKNKFVALFASILLLFSLPIGLAEFRYDGAVVRPLIQSVTRPLRGENRVPHNHQTYNPVELVNVFTRVLFAKPSNEAEEYFAYNLSHKMPFFTPLSQIFVSLVFGSGVVFLIKNRKKEDQILWILFGSFIFGLFVFNFIFQENFYEHYYMLIFPIFILLLAKILMQISKNFPVVIFIGLGMYFVVNVITLHNSSIKWPLVKKIELVKNSIGSLEGKPYAIYSSGDPYVNGGGWTELYNHYGHPAVKSYIYDTWGWIYAAYSLYPGEIQENDPKKIVVIRKENENVEVSGEVISTNRYKDLVIEVLNNYDSD